MQTEGRKVFFKIVSVFLLAFYCAFFIVAPVMAESLIPGTNYDPCRSRDSCDVNEGIRLLLTVSDLMVKFLGIAALIFFIYGGFVWMTSAGRAAEIKRGQNILLGALIGMVIVLSAYTGIKFLEDSLGITASFNPFKS